MLADLIRRVDHALWQSPLYQLPEWKRRLLVVARVLFVLARDLAGGGLTLRAMSLVYTTLLSFVPLLAFSFSVLKAFGAHHNQLRPLLETFLAPLGEQGEETVQRIMQFIENMNVGVLGAAGLALLVYTVISLMQKIEEALNFIWHVPQARTVGERFSRYLSVLLIGPLLVFSALGITATVVGIGWIKWVLALGPLQHVAAAVAAAMPYLLVIAGFTFVYVFIPNTRVRFWPALLGGVVGGVLWQTAGWAFAVFAASSTRYEAIYSGFAILILFMIWLYLSWLILLFGASVAFYAQHPQYVVPLGGEPRMSNRMRERIGLALMFHVAAAFARAQPAPDQQELADAVGVPRHSAARLIDALVSAGLVARVEQNRYLPARDIARLGVHEVVEALRAEGEDRYVNVRSIEVPPAVGELLERLDEERRRALGGLTVAQWVGGTPRA